MERLVEVTQVLLKEGVNGSEGNVVCSPLSLAAMLSMLAVGSKGGALEKLLASLGCKTIADLETKYPNLLAVAADGGGGSDRKKIKGGKGPVINLVNGVWVNQLYTLKPSFEEVVTSVFRAAVKSLDFNKADEATNEVNLWIKNATNGLISDIIQPGFITLATTIILANALYFKGAWVCPFDVSRTMDKNFHLLNGETVQVPFMSSDPIGSHFYKSFNNFKVVKLPYQNSHDHRQFSMYLFLPNERDGLHKLLQEFIDNPDFLNQYLHLPKRELDRFLIPKFEFSYTFSVFKIMHDLGFNAAEVTEMMDCPNDIPVDFIQISRIVVNEEGTEAAAVTIMGEGCCMYTPPPLSFVADHPFMFMIKDDTFGTPFFIGAVLNPLDSRFFLLWCIWVT